MPLPPRRGGMQLEALLRKTPIGRLVFGLGWRAARNSPDQTS